MRPDPTIEGAGWGPSPVTSIKGCHLHWIFIGFRRLSKNKVALIQSQLQLQVEASRAKGHQIEGLDMLLGHPAVSSIGSTEILNNDDELGSDIHTQTQL